MSQTKAQLLGPVLGTVEYAGDVNFDSGTLFVDSTNNRVGIGGTTPESKLHIKSAGVDYLFIENTSSTNVGLRFKNSIRDWYLLNDANGDIQFYNGTANAIRLKLTSDGNVGIGTNTAYAKLQVEGNILTQLLNGSPYIISRGSYSDNTTYTFYNNDTTGFTNPSAGTIGIKNSGAYTATFTSNNYVGIGTDTPTVDIELNKSASSVRQLIRNTLDTGYAALSIGSNTGTLHIGFRGDSYASTYGVIGPGMGYIDGSIDNLGIQTVGNILFGAGSSTGNIGERLRITSSGNVGIGTTNPGVKLDVHGNSAAVRVFESPDGADVRVVAGGSTGYIGTYSQDNLQILSGGATAIIANTSQNVGIGGAITPDVRLHINGANAYPATSGTTPTGFIALRNTAGSTHGAYIGVANAAPWGTWIQAQDKNNLGTSYPILLNPNGGNVGIGTTNPSSKLDVNGSVSANDSYRLDDSNTAAVIQIQSDINGNYTGWKERNVASGSMSQASIDSKTPTINDFTYPNSSNGMLIWSTSTIGFAAGSESPQFGTGVQMLYDASGLALSGYRAFDRTSSVSSSTANIKLFSQNGNATFAGNVGIGTTNPGSRLEIRTAGTNSVSGQLFNAGFTQTIVAGEPQTCFISNINDQGASGSTEVARGGIGFSWASVADRTRFIVGTNSNHPLRLYTNASEKVRITESGILDAKYGVVAPIGWAYQNTYTANSTWSSGWQTIIPNGICSFGTYVVSLYWDYATAPSAGLPYYITAATIFTAVPGTNGTGTENAVALLSATHTGGTGAYLQVRTIAFPSGTTGLQVNIVNYTAVSGTIFTVYVQKIGY